MGNIDTVASILNTLTSYTITKYPDYITNNGYNLFNPIPPFTRHHNMYIENYPIQICANSAALLETAITKFLECASEHGSGYTFATAGYPSWISIDLNYKNIKDLVANLTVRVYWGL